MLSFIGDLFITILAVCVIGFMVLCAIITAFRTPPAPPKDTRSRKEIYESYIHSSAWRNRRKRALELANYKCEKCGCKENLHVHHLSYEHFGNELDNELQVLCRECHQRVHGKRF